MLRFCLFLLPMTLLAGEPAVEYFEMREKPWNGDWFNQSLDQMVHGEFFQGYPGPLPKALIALGLDDDHPAVEFELRMIVDRDAPAWHGSCNGWAAAAIQLAPPEAAIINGIKIFPGELRGLLASIWKDNKVITVGVEDSSGITAEWFDYVLEEYVAKNKGIIFDVALGQEAWNYPVSAFERTTTENGDWLEHQVTVYYTNTSTLWFLRESDLDVDLLPLTYSYKESVAFPKVYEWTSSDRPQRAWYANEPFLTGKWAVRANHYMNMNHYARILELAETENLDDVYEPNEDWTQAAAVKSNVVLACAVPGDDDWFRFEKTPGELLQMEMMVYDGPAVDMILRDSQGTPIDSLTNAVDGTITFSEEMDGPVFLQVVPPLNQPAFYKVVRSEDRGWFHTYPGSQREGANLTVINVAGVENQLSDGQEHETMAIDGSRVYPSLTADHDFRTTEKTIWGIERMDDQGVVHKKVMRGHPKKVPAIVPHVTCRNGWQTLLFLDRSNDDEVRIEVFNQEGNRLFYQVLPNQPVVDLGPYMGEAVANAATWFRLHSSDANQLTGRVTFCHEGLGYAADYDISNRVRTGEMVLPDLPADDEGWLGISIANTSGVVNEILYRLVDERANILEEGSFDLGPNQRWLGLPSHLVSTPIQKDYKLYFFSQWDIDTLALRHDTELGADYAHRFFNTLVDYVTEESFLLPPSSSDIQSTYVFANIERRANWVRVRGYDDGGQLLMEYRLHNRALTAFEITHFTYEELLTEAGLNPEANGINYFKITSSQPFVCYELVGTRTGPAKTFVLPATIYNNKP